MTRNRSRKYLRPLGLVALIALALVLVAPHSGAHAASPVRLVSTVTIPVSGTNTSGGMFSFDISFVDRATGTYYLADRSNQAVDIVVAETFVTQLTGGFAGPTPCPFQPSGANDCAGPN